MAKIKIHEERGLFGYMCPICENEDLELGQYYCQICGEAIEWIDDGPAEGNPVVPGTEG